MDSHLECGGEALQRLLTEVIVVEKQQQLENTPLIKTSNTIEMMLFVDKLNWEREESGNILSEQGLSCKNQTVKAKL